MFMIAAVLLNNESKSPMLLLLFGTKVPGDKRSRKRFKEWKFQGQSSRERKFHLTTFVPGNESSRVQKIQLPC